MHAAASETGADDPDAKDKFTALLNAQPVGYTEPHGCLYAGYENRYVQYAVNKILNGSHVMCIVKYTDEKIKNLGYLYAPSLPGGPEAGAYCVL